MHLKSYVCILQLTTDTINRMAIEIFLLVLGLTGLYFGSEWLVCGASRLARSYNVSPLIIGLTIVSFGTSAPELLVSLFASESGAAGLSIGNIIGSNIINIALVLGMSILLKPMVIHRQKIATELYFMVGTSLLFWILCMNGTISRADGTILIGLLVAYLIYRFFNPKTHDCDAQEESAFTKGPLINGIAVIIGTVVLCTGAHFVVKSAMAMADYFQISNTFIGLTIVAFGTSLPELAASLMAAKKMESDIAIGNVVGSNIFNACMVMGAVGTISPLEVESGLHRFEFPFMILISISLLFLVHKNSLLKRIHGMGYVGFFLLYIGISWYVTGL